MKTQINGEFGRKDKVLVTYCNPYYNIENVPGIIILKNNKPGFQFQVHLQDENGNDINRGHDKNQGEPGSGPFIFVDSSNLTLVEKYEVKRLEGEIKNDWKVGDKFTPKKDFTMDACDTDDVTGVNQDMIDCQGKELTIIGILNVVGPIQLLDNTVNKFWLPEWIDEVG